MTLARPLLVVAVAIVLLLAAVWLGATLEKRLLAWVWPIIAPAPVLAFVGALLLLLIHDLRCIARDLEQERAECDRIEASQKLLMTIMEEMPATVIMTDTEGRIQYVNRRFEELTGWTRNQALGHTPSYLQYGETDDATYKAIRERLAAGAPWHGTLRTLRQDGSGYRAETTLLPLKSKDGIMQNLVGIGQDIVEELEGTERETEEDRGGRSQPNDESIP